MAIYKWIYILKVVVSRNRMFCSIYFSICILQYNRICSGCIALQVVFSGTRFIVKHSFPYKWPLFLLLPKQIVSLFLHLWDHQRAWSTPILMLFYLLGHHLLMPVCCLSLVLRRSPRSAVNSINAFRWLYLCNFNIPKTHFNFGYTDSKTYISAFENVAAVHGHLKWSKLLRYCWQSLKISLVKSHNFYVITFEPILPFPEGSWAFLVVRFPLLAQIPNEQPLYVGL